MENLRTLKHDTVRSINTLECAVECLQKDNSEEKKKELLGLISKEIKKVKQTLTNYYNTI